MGAQGNEQWQELEQGVIVISDGESANEGPQPKRQKTAIAPPHGGSTEEDAKAEEQWQEDAKAEFLSVLSLFSQEPPQTGAGSQPTDGGLRRHVVWVYWDVSPGEWEMWQMLDTAWQGELNRKKCEGIKEAVLSHREILGPRTCEYKVDIQTKTMWRMRQNPLEKAWCLNEVPMLDLGPWAMLPFMLQDEIYQQYWQCYPGYDLQWQFEGAWGWKNFAPVPNADLLRDLSQLTKTGAPLVTTVTHVWTKNRPELFTVDFLAMTQVLKGGIVGKSDLRLVAFPAGLMTPPARPGGAAPEVRSEPVHVGDDVPAHLRVGLPAASSRGF